MQFITVAPEPLAPLARRLAHALSMHDGHTGTYWSLKHYEDNESSLANQPVIFLGDSAVARSYTDVLPVRFSDFGTTCWFEGTKVVLIADMPSRVSVDELSRLERIVLGRAEELRHIAGASSAETGGEPPVKALTSGTIPAVGELPLGVRVAIAATPVVVAGRGVVNFVVRTVNSRNRKRSYLTAQYRYLLDRFLKDEFERFVAAINGK